MVRSNLLDQIPNIRYGFGTAKDPISEHLIENWQVAAPKWKQVHGVQIAKVTQKNQNCGEVDALWAETPGYPIGIVTADCVPILLSRKDGSKVAAVHAGWRGTYAHILRELWKTLKSENAENWVACVGPAISSKNYEVSEDLANQFAEEFKDILPLEKILPMPRHLDLQGINSAELRKMGFQDVEVIHKCTFGSQTEGQPEFHSYRRGNQGARQWSIIEISGN